MLGPKKLSALERTDCQGLVQLLMAADLSPQTIRNAMMPLRVICRDADHVIGRRLPVNPTLQPTEKSEMRFYTREEVNDRAEA